jgi:hypothetical protein
MPNSRGSLKRLWGWIKDQIVQDVPEHLAVCEFDCRCVHRCHRNQCTPDAWEPRETRLYRVAQYIGGTVPTPEVKGSNRRFDAEEAHGV